MPPSVNRTETFSDNTTTVTTETIDDIAVTTTETNNQTTTKTNESSGNLIACPCRRLNLHKLVEETRCWSFQSSNISAAHANAALVFAMTILQQILIDTCKQERVNVNDIFLIATAIAEMGEVLKVYNPAPFNS